MTFDVNMGTPRTMPPVMSIATPLKETSSYTSAKGLTNRPGQNNCFLNSSIQVLWHLDVFRRSFRDLTGHACLAESCIFCALKELFSELQHSPAKALPPDSLRKALADSFLDQQRFQIGFMDDAAECFENMLLRIHDHIAHREPEDACSAPHCISHQKFAMNLVEQSVCDSCGATTEPMSFTQMVQYVSTSTLVHQFRISVGQTGRPDAFGRLLQKAGNMGDTRPCPASCGSVTQMCRVLMNHPEIISIGLVWNSEKPSLDHIMEVFSCIDTTLRLNQVFTSVTDAKWAETTTHNLVGIVTYYGKHYSTFFFHTKLMEWIYLDDATVRDVGPRWEQVVEKCRKGKFQPLLLLYATPNGTPVNLQYAPKMNTPFYTNDNNNKKPPSTNQQVLRRSVTPSPEKPNINNTRRAITPNPENSPLNQKPPLPNKPYNEYQNLSVIQKNINCDQVDGCMSPRGTEYLTRSNSNKLENGKPYQVNIHRTLSNGSSSGVESGVCMPDHMNIPRRRDSGNFSGDRNSASSASSTTMENPYLYLVGKMPHGSVPSSPTRTKADGNVMSYDAGYDSYSISSNDSNNMTTLQHIMKAGHLAQIPEDYSNIALNQNSQSCDVLCDEADELLVKSRQLEDQHDLVLALALCNAAATKARAAMNAPYNNPQTLTLARMKHNTCIMRARSLHRRMTQTQALNKENSPEIRHTREGSSGSGRHSRQNSRDKASHSRQSSRELLLQQEKEKAKSTKSIEIYATLPKKKDALKAKMNAINIEDEEYMMYNTKAPPAERESRSIFSRSKSKDSSKIKEKRSRSEDRNKIGRGVDFSIAPNIAVAKDTLKKAKESKEKEEKKDKDGKNKKQHKIRRKLLMGGLIRRKNRSMPDLTDSTAENHHHPTTNTVSIDDGNVSTKAGPEAITQGMSGYLSEGHLEFSGATANPNLERSKLMRKSFHGSAGKILTAAKVPPPPPLRTTSQLSRSKSNISAEVVNKVSQFNIYGDVNIYHNLAPFNQVSRCGGDNDDDDEEEQASMSLPYYGNSNSSYDDDSFAGHHTVVTQADVHHEQESPNITTNIDSGVDEVDCMPSHQDLPPYPSPGGSTIHSRQASEDFPPPPPPLDLSSLEEHLPKHELAIIQQQPDPNSLLAQLQIKRNQILTTQQTSKQVVRSSGDTWLKELQAKQAALKIKRNDQPSMDNGVDEVNTQRYQPGEAKVKSVKDLASKFENNNDSQKPIAKSPSTGSLSINNHTSIAPEQIAQELREVEMITSAVNKVFGNNQQQDDLQFKTKPQKKKSVSFCDQVTLVATAEEQEDDTYIPNPILERVLRSAVNNPEAMAIRQEILSLREQSPANDPEQALYVRRNSMENLIEAAPREVTSYPHFNQQYPVYQYNLNHLPQQQQQQIPNCQQQYSPLENPYIHYNNNRVYQDQRSCYNHHQQPEVMMEIPQLNHYSPYQCIPQNSPAHPAYYGNNRMPFNPRSSPYNPVNVRQTTPSPSAVNFNHHPPSPVPSINSTTNNYHPAMYNRINPVYQRVPAVPNDVYQRVPFLPGDDPTRYPAVYQQVPSNKQHLPLKKTVSFEAGTKGCESPIPKPVVTPIVVNNANNSVPTDKTKCSLCRKKNVVTLNMYCKDCEFYMSRFKPKT